MHKLVASVNMTPCQLGVILSRRWIDGTRGTVWMFLSLLLFAVDCTGIRYRDQEMSELKCIRLTGTSSSGKYCTEHQTLDSV